MDNNEIQSSYEDTLQYLQCEICLEDFKNREIKLCQNGHSMCENCGIKLSSCPFCRSKMASGNNVILQELASLVRYPCENSGCTEYIKISEQLSHFLICNFNKITCPCNLFTSHQKCFWKGVINNIFAHLEEIHYDRYSTSTISKNCKISTLACDIQILNHENHIFFLYTRQIDYKIYWYVGTGGLFQTNIQNAFNIGYYYEIRITDDRYQGIAFIMKKKCNVHDKVDNSVLIRLNVTTTFNFLKRLVNPKYTLKITSKTENLNVPNIFFVPSCENNPRTNKHKCPFYYLLNVRCLWNGKRAELSEHFEIHHSNQYSTHFRQRKINYKLQVDLQVIKAGNEFFYLFIVSEPGLIYFVVQWFGVEAIANHYYYEMSFPKSNLLTISGRCFDNTTRITNIIGKIEEHAFPIYASHLMSKKYFLQIKPKE